MTNISSEIRVEPFLFGDAGWCPNNSRLPLLVYRKVSEVAPGDELAAWFEECFARHGWPPEWRYTVYPFPHYHSTSHEVIGVFRGRAQVRFGDAAGETLEVIAGDTVVIPAGVSHQLLDSEDDFCGVGAYPAGFEYDLLRRENSDVLAAQARIANVPLPEQDPVTGGKGPLHHYWR
jgi:uncharacterized protein YjlB